MKDKILYILMNTGGFILVVIASSVLYGHVYHIPKLYSWGFEGALSVPGNACLWIIGLMMWSMSNRLNKIEEFIRKLVSKQN